MHADCKSSPNITMELSRLNGQVLEGFLQGGPFQGYIRACNRTTTHKIQNVSLAMCEQAAQVHAGSSAVLDWGMSSEKQREVKG